MNWTPSPRTLLLCFLIVAAPGLGAQTPPQPPLAPAPAPDQMSWLDNGQVRLGADLDLGGAVTFLSGPSSKENMINSADWGRQIQLSFYSGPSPFAPPGVTLQPAWRGLGWNPIQSGDCYKHRSRVLETTNDGTTLHVKSVPMIWPLDGYPGECTFECWYRLAGNTVEVTSRLNNARPDLTQYPARGQELPALYTNGPWYKMVAYCGDQPFTSAPVTTLMDRDDGRGWPWIPFFSTESWAALLNQDDVGLGIYQPGVIQILGGFAGKPKGSGGAHDSQTGYLAPIRNEILDHDIVYTFHYVLIAGSLTEIRAYVNAHRPESMVPAWNFAQDRQGWTYQNATDTGWPIRGELNVKPSGPNPALISPLAFWPSAQAPTLTIEAAFEGKADGVTVTFKPYGEENRTPFTDWAKHTKTPATPWTAALPLQAQSDGQFHTYQIPLANLPGYTGALIQMKLLIPPETIRIRVKSIGFIAPVIQ